MRVQKDFKFGALLAAEVVHERYNIQGDIYVAW
jgi:hypothetical protein